MLGSLNHSSGVEADSGVWLNQKKQHNPASNTQVINLKKSLMVLTKSFTPICQQFL
jgi:hypothetical protein